MVAEHGVPRVTRGVESFPKERRLRRRPEYTAVYDSGRKAQGRYATVFALPGERPGTRLGVTVTRRVGGSVERNRARRRVREIFRRLRLPQGAPGLQIVVNVHPRAVKAPFAELAAELSRLLARAMEPVR